MGKGLDVQETGVHIAFVAGTGILPFLDLVSLLIRLNSGLPSRQNGGFNEIEEANQNETIPDAKVFH